MSTPLENRLKKLLADYQRIQSLLAEIIMEAENPAIVDFSSTDKASAAVNNLSEQIYIIEQQLKQLKNQRRRNPYYRRNAGTLSGGPPEDEHWDDVAPGGIDPATGRHRDYWVLPESERAKGFVRPLRREYTHIVCGGHTIMGLSIAETYARDPSYYQGTFCATCKKHYPNEEFVWKDTDTFLGS
jgi:hypothetical protein